MKTAIISIMHHYFRHFREWIWVWHIFIYTFTHLTGTCFLADFLKQKFIVSFYGSFFINVRAKILRFLFLRGQNQHEHWVTFQLYSCTAFFPGCLMSLTRKAPSVQVATLGWFIQKSYNTYVLLQTIFDRKSGSLVFCTLFAHEDNIWANWNLEKK